ncbi:MAG: hypothetical protein K0U59_07300 [Gammaproteobacteria bacterium]|nr:hypothetical protein [Gammaproteobacteria bacterium]
MRNSKVTAWSFAQRVNSDQKNIHLRALAFATAYLLLSMFALKPLPARAEAVPLIGLTDFTDDFGQRFAASDLVAQVQILGVHRELDRALSGPGMAAILGYVYFATLQRAWKGQIDGQLAFRLGFDVCPHKLKKRGRYVIFAHKNSQGRLQLLDCDGFVAEAEAVPLLAHLEQMGQQG